jgi:hypothetical protein
MKPSQLITYGCSHTYGQGLPDCVNESDVLQAGPDPSALAWPSILRQLLKIKHLDNRSIPGASNKMIAHRIFNSTFNEGDVVVVLWTRLARQTIYKSKDKYLHMMPAFVEKKMSKGFWKTINDKYGSEVDQYKQNISTYFSEFFEEYDAQFDQITRINHVHALLESKKVKSYHLLIDTEMHINQFKHMLLPNLNYKEFSWHPQFKIDNALDNIHPGVVSHKQFAVNTRNWFFK